MLSVRKTEIWVAFDMWQTVSLGLNKWQWSARRESMWECPVGQGGVEETSGWVW